MARGFKSSKEQKNFDSSKAIIPPPWACPAETTEIEMKENDGECRQAEQQQKQETRGCQSSLMHRRKRLHCKGSRSNKEEKNFDRSNAINPPPWAGHAKLKQIVPLAFEENDGEGRQPEQQQKLNALDVFRHQRGSSLDGLEFLCPSYQWPSKNYHCHSFSHLHFS